MSEHTCRSATLPVAIGEAEKILKRALELLEPPKAWLEEHGFTRLWRACKEIRKSGVFHSRKHTVACRRRCTEWVGEQHAEKQSGRLRQARTQRPKGVSERTHSMVAAFYFAAFLATRHSLSHSIAGAAKCIMVSLSLFPTTKPTQSESGL